MSALCKALHKAEDRLFSVDYSPLESWSVDPVIPLTLEPAIAASNLTKSFAGKSLPGKKLSLKWGIMKKSHHLIPCLNQGYIFITCTNRHMISSQSKEKHHQPPAILERFERYLKSRNLPYWVYGHPYYIKFNLPLHKHSVEAYIDFLHEDEMNCIFVGSVLPTKIFMSDVDEIQNAVDSLENLLPTGWLWLDVGDEFITLTTQMEYAKNISDAAIEYVVESNVNISNLLLGVLSSERLSVKSLDLIAEQLKKLRGAFFH